MNDLLRLETKYAYNSLINNMSAPISVDSHRYRHQLELIAMRGKVHFGKYEWTIPECPFVFAFYGGIFTTEVIPSRVVSAKIYLDPQGNLIPYLLGLIRKWHETCVEIHTALPQPVAEAIEYSLEWEQRGEFCAAVKCGYIFDYFPRDMLKMVYVPHDATP